MGIGNLTRLADNPNDWDCAALRFDVVKIYIGEIQSKTVTDLYYLVQSLKSNHIKIAIEMAGLTKSSWNQGTLSAEFSFNQQNAIIQKLTGQPVFSQSGAGEVFVSGGAGADVSYLVFDGPIRRVVWPNSQDPSGQPSFHTVDSATDEVVDAMGLWANEIPGVQIIVLSNFPNWGWKGSPAYNNFGLPPGMTGWGDYFEILDKITTKAAALGVPLTGFAADNPYGYALGNHTTNQAHTIAGIDWIARLLDFENDVHLRGLEFHQIFNSEIGGAVSNIDFEVETLDFIDLYLASGGQPDAAVLQTWYDFPDALTPDDLPGTMTNLIITAAPKFGPITVCP
jgi:hypothetical protein